MSLPITPLQLPEALKSIAKANLVPFIHGSPGTSKSDCVEQFAATHSLKLYDDLVLSTSDPTDIAGFPVNRGARMDFVPLSTVPLAGDDLGKHNGACLFLDEFNSAPLSVQAAAYRLILNRKIGKHHLHPLTVIICAGNKQTDKAITNQLSTAMQSRLVHLELEMDTPSWLAWANRNGIDQRIISFIKFRPNLLEKFDPNHNGHTFLCGRTLEFASKHMVNVPGPMTDLDLAIIAGCISEGPAVELKVYCDIYKQLPTIKEILANPESVTIKDEPSIQYAFTTLISHNATSSNLNQLMKFVVRLPIDFQVVCLRELIAKTPAFLDHPAIETWIGDHSEQLF